MVDALVLGTSFLGSESSSLSSGTNIMKKEYHNIRFCDESRTIMYDIHYTKPGYKYARCQNQRTGVMSKKEYFKCKLKGEFDGNV